MITNSSCVVVWIRFFMIMAGVVAMASVIEDFDTQVCI